MSHNVLDTDCEICAAAEKDIKYFTTKATADILHHIHERQPKLTEHLPVHRIILAMINDLFDTLHKAVNVTSEKLPSEIIELARREMQRDAIETIGGIMEATLPVIARTHSVPADVDLNEAIDSLFEGTDEPQVH